MAAFKSTRSTYKCCMVPKCGNTTVSSPGKIFFSVPKREEIRKIWCKAMNRSKEIRVSSKSSMFCCEDHFSLPDDMDNFYKLKLMPNFFKIKKLKKTAIPHIFKCQEQDSKMSSLDHLQKKELVTIKTDISGVSNDNKSDADKRIKKEVYQDGDIPCDCTEYVLGDTHKVSDHLDMDLSHNNPVCDEFHKGRLPTCDDNSEPQRTMASQDTQSHVKEFKCDHCSTEFKYLCRETKKLEQSPREKLFMCDRCNKKFAFLTTLEKHIRMHSEEKSPVCVVCRESFAITSDLNSHQRLVHKKTTFFECYICHERFTDRGCLQEHNLTHAQEKPHACTHCEYRYSSEDNLRLHMEIVHKIESNSHLRQRLMHKEATFVCCVCRKRFTDRDCLEKHNLVHAQEKPYACIHCKFRFSSEDGLKLHMEIIHKIVEIETVFLPAFE